MEGATLDLLNSTKKAKCDLCAKEFANLGVLKRSRSQERKLQM